MSRQVQALHDCAVQSAGAHIIFSPLCSLFGCEPEAEAAQLRACCVQTRLKATKDDLMNRLNNALKQRDAAREDALVQAEKLTKLQVLVHCHTGLNAQVLPACGGAAARTAKSAVRGKSQRWAQRADSGCRRTLSQERWCRGALQRLRSSQSRGLSHPRCRWCILLSRMASQVNPFPKRLKLHLHWASIQQDHAASCSVCQQEPSSLALQQDSARVQSLA